MACIIHLHMQFICIFHKESARVWLCRSVSKYILALVTTLHLIGRITGVVCFY